MRYRISFRDFIAGAVFGLLVGSATLSVASIRYEGWARLSQDFKTGYVTGFLSCANLVRNLDPGGFLDSKYPAVPQATPTEWAAAVDQLYKDPANQGYSIHSILQSAAQEMERKYGKAIDPHIRAAQRALSQMARLKKKSEAEGPVVKKPEKIVKAPEKTVKQPVTKKPRKWCRCDGKDPKVERAKRRAEAARKAAESTKPEGAKAADPATKAEGAKGADPAKKPDAAAPPSPPAN